MNAPADKQQGDEAADVPGHGDLDALSGFLIRSLLASMGRADAAAEDGARAAQLKAARNAAETGGPPQAESAMTTPAERERMLRHMRSAKDGYYAMAVAVGDHAFVEFAGHIGEYIKLCEACHARGLDFTELSDVMQAYHAKYIGEKLGCIYGPAFLRSEKLLSAFLAGFIGFDHSSPREFVIAERPREPKTTGPSVHVKEHVPAFIDRGTEPFECEIRSWEELLELEFVKRWTGSAGFQQLAFTPDAPGRVLLMAEVVEQGKRQAWVIAYLTGSQAGIDALKLPPLKG